MNKTIRFGSVHIPLADYATQGNAVLGIRGSGKSYTSMCAAEQLLDHGIPIVAFDPVGIWRNLKIPRQAGGKAYKVVVAGGQQPDLPLSPATAPQILRAAIGENIPLVIDLFDTKLTKSDWRKIVLECCNLLMHENLVIRHVFIEEAADFVPQRVQDGQVYSAVERLVRMGGNKSIGVTLINQRAEELNKAVLELCDLIILHRQKGRRSLKALEDWVTMLADMEDIARRISEFGAGECFVWPEGEAPVPTKVQEKQTYHPDRKRPALPKDAMPEDVHGFVAQMSTTLRKVLEDAKANDPAELKKQIAALQQQIRKLEAAKPAPSQPLPAVEVPVLSKDDLEEWKTVCDGVLEEHWKLEGMLVEHQKQLEKFKGDLAKVANRSFPPSNMGTMGTAAKPYSKPLTAHGAKLNTGAQLPKGEAAILTAIVQYVGCTREQLTVLTGYKRSSRDTYLQRLSEKGFTESTGDNGMIIATDSGIAALGDAYEPLPTGDALREYHLARLPTGEAKILEVLINDYPSWVVREHLSNVTGYQRSSRDTYLQRLGARKLIESDRGTGTVRASKILFDE